MAPRTPARRFENVLNGSLCGFRRVRRMRYCALRLAHAGVKRGDDLCHGDAASTQPSGVITSPAAIIFGVASNISATTLLATELPPGRDHVSSSVMRLICAA